MGSRMRTTRASHMLALRALPRFLLERHVSSARHPALRDQTMHPACAVDPPHPPSTPHCRRCRMPTGRWRAQFTYRNKVGRCHRQECGRVALPEHGLPEQRCIPRLPQVIQVGMYDTEEEVGGGWEQRLEGLEASSCKAHLGRVGRLERGLTRARCVPATHTRATMLAARYLCLTLKRPVARILHTCRRLQGRGTRPPSSTEARCRRCCFPVCGEGRHLCRRHTQPAPGSCAPSAAVICG